MTETEYLAKRHDIITLFKSKQIQSVEAIRRLKQLESDYRNIRRRLAKRGAHENRKE